MKYRIMMSVEIEASGDRQAYEDAIKLEGLLRSPMVRLAVEAEGVRLSDGDGKPIVHEPQRSFA